MTNELYSDLNSLAEKCLARAKELTMEDTVLATGRQLELLSFAGQLLKIMAEHGSATKVQ